MKTPRFFPSGMFQQPRLMTEDIHVLQTSGLSTPTRMEPPSLNYGWAPITQSRAGVSFLEPRSPQSPSWHHLVNYYGNHGNHGMNR